MDKNINMTEQKAYASKFDQEIYNKFKNISWYFNFKIEEFKDKIKLKKYNENDNYKTKTIFFTEKNHKFVKNMFYIHDVTIRDYIQSVMEKTISSEEKEPQN